MENLGRARNALAVGWSTASGGSLFEAHQQVAWDARAGCLDHPFLLSWWLNSWLTVFAPSALPAGRLWEPNVGAPLIVGRRPGLLCAAANVHVPISGSLSGISLPLAEVLPPTIRHLVWPRLEQHEAAGLANRLQAKGWLARVEPQHVSPVVAMADSYTVYERALGRNLRQRARRLQRKLQREQGATLAITHPVENPTLFERCLRLEAAGWKGRSGTAILSNPLTTAFYRGVARDAKATLFALDGVDGLLAFALCLRHRERFFLIKTAFDERHRSASPGLVVHYAAIRACHEAGIEAYELLGAADPWKLQFANDQRLISRLVADRRTVSGYAHHSLRATRPAAKTAKMWLVRLSDRDRHRGGGLTA